MLIRNPLAIMTGLAGDAARARGDLRIEGSRITAIGALAPLPGEAIVDATDCVVYPGWVNTHHHLFQSVMKGVPRGIDLPLMGWLREVPYRLWHRFDENAARVAFRIGLVELLLSGTTTVADHHYLFGKALGFDPTPILFEEAAALGLRFVLCRGGATMARSFDTPDIRAMPTETLDEFIAEVEATTRRWHDPAPDAMRRVALAPSTPMWSCTPTELDAFAVAARRLGIRLHSHLSETRDYVTYTREVHGCTPMQFVADHGWTGPDVWFAHMVHLDESEVAMVAATGTAIAHCPQSNCRLGSGIAPATALDRLGGIVSLAVDGAASNESADMIMEANTAWHVHRALRGANDVTVEDVVRWGTQGGARALGLPDIGRIEVGACADLAIYRLDHPRYAGLHDPAIGPVVAGGAAQLARVLVGGRTVMTDGEILGVDLPTLAAEARAVVRRMQD